MGTTASFVVGGFDALPAHVAILNDEGEIVYTNQSWDSFAASQGLDADECGVGTDYLAVCDDSTETDGPDAAEGIRAIADGERDSFTLEYPCHSPSTRRWFTMQARSYHHDDERYVLVMHADITERRLLEQQARDQADRMEAFATLLSHDLRNPLAVAIAATESLDLESERESLERIGTGEIGDSTLRTSLERMETIIDDALVLVKTDRVEHPELVRLDDAVESAWSNVRTNDATVSVLGSIAVRADPSLLAHAFENLFRNATEHGGKSPSIEVGPLERASNGESATEPASSPYRGSGSERAEERKIIDGFYVEDDGPGIPSEYREQIFESGYTTDNDGTGFGLAIVARVVDAHGWSIAVSDADHGGTRFEIRDVVALALPSDDTSHESG
ncbi:ATP-binding protein [Natronorubrum sp. DTA28]|uniref:PAS domain-containing sensor histidine kinase n=1 Tax=Natronorubrum sp. DTA28 TaxID=3447019 RepID=UPI003F865D54